MKIEKSAPVSKTPEHQSGTGIVKLSDGEIIVCEVMDKNDHTVLLKSEQGSLFTAQLLDDIDIAAGDDVEMIVVGSENGQYILKVLDIRGRKPGHGTNDGSRETAANEQSIKTQVLINTMTMLKKNPGIGSKTAGFFAKSNIPNTPENIRTLSQLLYGDNRIGRILTELLSAVRSQNDKAADAALPEKAPENTYKDGDGAAIAGEEQPADAAGKLHLWQAPQTDGPIQAQDKYTQPYPGKNVQTLSPPDSIPEDAPEVFTGQETPLQQSPGWMAQEKRYTADESGFSVFQEESDPGSAAIPAGQDMRTENETPAQEGYAKTADATAQKEADISPDGTVEKTGTEIQNNIEEKILSIFFRPDEKYQGGKIRNVINEMPEKVKELKLLLNRYDIRNKEAFIQKADRIEKQLMLMCEIKRFTCLQLPFMLKDQTQKTAELFVYRYKRKKEEADENILILLGLDTQYIGRVEALIKAKGESISLVFRLEDQSAMKEFESGVDELKEGIGKTGYDVTDIHIEELAGKITVLNAEEFLLQQAKVSTGKVDVRI